MFANSLLFPNQFAKFAIQGDIMSKRGLPIMSADRAFKRIRQFTDENNVPLKINKDDSGRQFPMGVIVHYLVDINDSMSVCDMDAYNFKSFEEADNFLVNGIAPYMSAQRYIELVDDIATGNQHYVSVREEGKNAECKYYFLMTRPAYDENNLWDE
jgi:hypothetical protein